MTSVSVNNKVGLLMGPASDVTLSHYVSQRSNNCWLCPLPALSPPFPPLIPLVLVYCCCYCLPLQGPEDLAPHPLSTGSQLISAVLPLEHMSSSPPLLLVHLTFLCRCRRVFELTTKTFSLTCIQAPHGFHSEVGDL